MMGSSQTFRLRRQLLRRSVTFGAAVFAVLSFAACASRADHPPKGAILLFSGKPQELADNWVMEGSDKAPTWEVQEGAMRTRDNSIVTKQQFTDFVLHVEFKVPYMPNEHGQGRGNSGVGLQGRYEIQVLDSYGIDGPGKGDCGAVYSQAAPLVNACKPPLQWQTYDIVFRAPRFDSDNHRTEKARVTVFQNGILIQNNQDIEGPTGIGGGSDLTKPGPIMLQYHHNAVEFRNVWVLPLPLKGADYYEKPH